jgi:hypothetical protein
MATIPQWTREDVDDACPEPGRKDPDGGDHTAVDAGGRRRRVFGAWAGSNLTSALFVCVGLHPESFQLIKIYIN